MKRVGWKIPTEEEVEIAEILLILPKLWRKSDILTRYSFTWGRTMKRSVPDFKSESPSPSPENTTPDKSPSTPLCFCSASGSDETANKVNNKRKGRDDLMEICNRMEQEREVLIKKLKAVNTLHQELTSENQQLKAKQQKMINYPMKLKIIDQQRCHQQITMFALPTPQQPQQHCLKQLVVDPNNGKLVAVSRFGFTNHNVKIHGETMGSSSQPLDQCNLVMDNDLRASNAAAARKRRMLKMKQKKL